MLILVLGSFPSTVSAAALARPSNNLGTEGYWPFDEGSGTTVSDMSGMNNDGELVGGPTWVSGKYSKAGSFDGTQEMTIQGGKALTTNATISGWFYWRSGATSLMRDHTSSNGWVFIWNSGGNITTRLAGVSFGTGIGVDPYLNKWTHYTVTKSGADVAVYLNGVLVYTGTGAGNTASTLPWHVMKNGTASGYITGEVDDLRIYSRTLSATEVLALYRTGKTFQKIATRSGLVGEWKFDEGTSTQAHDSSGFANAATLVNSPSWVPGKHAKAVRLDGNTQYVSIPDSAALNNGSMTASTWFTLTSEIDCDAVNNYRMLLNKNTGAAGWRVVLEQNKQPQFDVWPGGVQSRSGGVSVGLQTGVPIFLTFTYDAATGDQKVWANGVLKSTKANTPASLGTSPVALTIGKGGTTGSCPAGNGYTPGTYDDVRVYNRALSSSEIQALYNERTATINSSKNGKMTNGLVGLWSFDGPDIQGSTAYDRSGSGNNGTLFSSPKPSIGKLGQALSFDGAATYISLSNPASLQLSQGTVSAWIKTSNAGTSYRGIVSKGSAYGMYLMGNVFGVYDNGTPAFRTTGVNLADNKWHHVSFSFDSGVTNGTLLYIDGVLVLTTTLTNTSQATNVQVSRGQGGVSQIFNGAIDDVRIYNRILPASEIKQLYLMGK